MHLMDYPNCLPTIQFLIISPFLSHFNLTKYSLSFRTRSIPASFSIGQY